MPHNKLTLTRNSTDKIACHPCCLKDRYCLPRLAALDVTRPHNRICIVCKRKQQLALQLAVETRIGYCAELCIIRTCTDCLLSLQICVNEDNQNAVLSVPVVWYILHHNKPRNVRIT